MGQTTVVFPVAGFAKTTVVCPRLLTSLIGLYFPQLNPEAGRLLDAFSAHESVCDAIFLARLKRVRVKRHDESSESLLREVDDALLSMRPTPEEFKEFETTAKQFTDAGTQITLAIYKQMDNLMPLLR